MICCRHEEASRAPQAINKAAAWRHNSTSIKMYVAANRGRASRGKQASGIARSNAGTPQCSDGVNGDRQLKHQSQEAWQTWRQGVAITWAVAWRSRRINKRAGGGIISGRYVSGVSAEIRVAGISEEHARLSIIWVDFWSDMCSLGLQAGLLRYHVQAMEGDSCRRR